MIKYNFPIKIYYKDVDKMGIVYYSRYFEFFEIARTELLKSIGLSIVSMEERGVYLPVISANCEYKVPLRLEQEGNIIVHISTFPKSKLKILYTISTSFSSGICVNGYTEHAFMNELGKPTRPPKFFLSLFEKFWTYDG